MSAKLKTTDRAVAEVESMLATAARNSSSDPKATAVAGAAAEGEEAGRCGASTKFAPSITGVGKRAKSRLFDYESDQRSNKEYLEKQEAKHEELKRLSVQQLRIAAAERKKVLRDHLRESLSRERDALRSQSVAGQRAVRREIEAEDRVRREI